MKIKTQNEVQTIGPAFFDSGRKRGENEELESYEVPRLNEALSQFFAELRKVNGKEYEPDSEGHASVFRSLKREIIQNLSCDIQSSCRQDKS